MSWARRPFSLSGRRSRLALVASISAIVAGLVAFEAFLLIAATPPRTGTISGAVIRYVDEGSTATGEPWFGTASVNYSGGANGFPFAFVPGSTFNLSAQPVNYDNASHTIRSVLVNPPFQVVRTYPALPFEAEASDDFLLQVTLATPHDTGTYSVELSIVVGG